MHDLEACIFKYITVSAFHIYAQRGEDVAKRGGWKPCLKSSWKIIEKSWNCVYKFLWEPRTFPCDFQQVDI